jgi:peptidoglycan/LPS O-acetylase OafA/YrhL
MQPAAPRHLAPIDGLRAIAVAAVVLYHLAPALLPGGFVGVDLFFVVSGFVVSLALPATGKFRLLPLLALFYGRRAVRILPALYLCLFATAIAGMVFIPQSWLSGMTEKTGLAAVRGYSNVILASGHGDYFAPQAEYNMYTQTWSLGVEEQFYAIFPWLFLPWLTGRRVLSAVLFGAGLVASLAVAQHQAGPHPAAAFYLIFGRFWELALGVLAFQLSSVLPPIRSGPVPGLAGAASAALIGLALATTLPEHTPYPGSVLPCCATAVLLVLIRAGCAPAILHRFLTLPPMRLGGRLSYALYLWHWPVFVLFRWTIGLQAPLHATAAVLIAAAAAALSTRYVETPPRRALASGAISPSMAVAGAACLVLGFYPVFKAVAPLQARLSLSTVARHPLDWYPDRDGNRISPSGCRVRVSQDKTLTIDALIFRRTDCPAPDRPPRALFILGDSHAVAYWDLLLRDVMQTGGTGRLYYQGGCAVLGLKPNDPPSCRHFLTTAIAGLRAHLVPGDILFLPGLRIPRITDESVRFGRQRAAGLMIDDAHQAWRAADLAATIPVLASLAASFAIIVLEAPKPIFGAPIFRCADWFDRMNPACADGPTIPRATIEALRAPVMAEFQTVITAVPGIHVWDPLPLLCPGRICDAYDGTTPLFFDADHLSGAGNHKLASAFEAFAATLHR